MILALSVSAWAACGTPPCEQANAGQNAGAGATLDVAFSGSQTAARLNIVTVFLCNNVGCSNDTSAVTISVTDSNANTYNLAVNNVIVNTRRIATYYAMNIAGGANTVSISLGSCDGGGCFYLAASISEWSGLATSSALDQVGSAATTGTNPTVSTSMATTQADELVYSYVHAVSSDAVADLTEVSNLGTGADVAQYEEVAATGTQTGTWTATSEAYWANIVTFKEAGGAPATRQPCCLLGVF